MAVTVYASVAQFFQYGLPQTALGARTVADVTAALDTASSMMDDNFRGRWPLPFASVGISVSRRCVAIAVYLFLGGRGFSPVTGADQQVLAAFTDAEAWLDKVQRRVLFPDVVIDPTAKSLEAATPASYAQPVAISKPPRCWYQPGTG